MKLIQRNVNLGKAIRLSAWRKVALGTWATAKDPSVYGMLELDAEPLLRHIEKLRSETGVRVTLTHLVGRALGIVLHKHPELNCVRRLGKLYPRRTVDIFFQVATDEAGEDLTGMVVREINKKSLVDVAKEMDHTVKHIRVNKDPLFKKMKGLIKLTPSAWSRFILWIGEFLSFGLNVWSPLLGYPKDAFGSLMLTNIGSLGLDVAYAPLVPYSRVPVVIALGAVQDQPVVRGGSVVAGKVMKICVTIDHRLIDGVHGSRMAMTLKKLLANPEQL